MRWGGIARFLFAAGLAIALWHSAGPAAGKIRVAPSRNAPSALLRVLFVAPKASINFDCFSSTQ